VEFKERLRELRNSKGLTQEELGRKFNVIKQTVSSWEKGNSSPDIKMAAQLADFFGVTTDNLLGRNKNTQVNKKISPEELTKLFESLPPEEQKAFLIKHIIPVLSDEPKK
jgi:transcriptional regulator with XRE-family HTH domain